MNKKKLYWQIPFLLVLIIGSIAIVRCQRSMPYQHNKGFIFGTVYNITYQSNEDLQPQIEAELKKVNQTFSTFEANSLISQINQNKPVKVNEMFREVFTLAESISKETDGAFDITVAPMVNNKVKLVGNTIQKTDKRVMLDCSAIAKGYGSDIVARFLRRNGIKNFMVEIGGEIVTMGNSEQRLPWKIGVTKPTDDSVKVNQEIQTVLNVTDKAMATSGNYRNFYYKGGKKYAHTIDPKTGYPVQHSLLSATVLAKNCATADAYATSFMVMGIEKARKLLERHPELMAYFIYSDAKGNLQVWYSPSMKGKVVK